MIFAGRSGDNSNRFIVCLCCVAVHVAMGASLYPQRCVLFVCYVSCRMGAYPHLGKVTFILFYFWRFFTDMLSLNPCTGGLCSVCRGEPFKCSNASVLGFTFSCEMWKCVLVGPVCSGLSEVARDSDWSPPMPAWSRAELSLSIVNGTDHDAYAAVVE